MVVLAHDAQAYSSPYSGRMAGPSHLLPYIHLFLAVLTNLSPATTMREVRNVMLKYYY